MSFSSHIIKAVPFFLLLLSCFLPQLLLSQSEIRIRINNELDDVEEYLGSLPLNNATLGGYDQPSSDLELGSEDGDMNAQLVGLRFNNLAIPKGASILSAYVNFVVDKTDRSADPSNLVIYGEAVDSSLPFDINQLFNLSSRVKTDSVMMTFPVSSWANERDVERTVDLAMIIQEIIDRPGWASGNSLSLFIKGTGTREAESFEGSRDDFPNEEPELVISYGFVSENSYAVIRGTDDAEETGPQGSTLGSMNLTSGDLDLGINTVDNNDSQRVGIRFDNVDIQAGDTILNAYIQFTADEDDGTPGNKFILIEDTDSSLSFNTSPFNISSRNYIADTIRWSAPLWDVERARGPNERSPDLSSLIQAILNRAGWKAGNALSFSIQGNGIHEASSFENGFNNPALAPKLIIRKASDSPELNSFPVRRGERWAYFDEGTDPGTSWNRPGFDFSGWKAGLGQLGYGDGDERSILDFGSDPNNKHISYYFIREFEVEDKDIFDSLKLSLLKDDGAIVYLNGGEIYRSNMPQGPITNSTLAISDLDANTENNFETVILPNSLVNGNNMLTVEVHQSAANSDDLSFDLSLEGTDFPAPTVDFPIRKKESWSYLDNGTDPGNSWKRPTFDFSDWEYGFGQLGYGEDDEATVLSFGSNPNLKPISTYFIKKFNVDTTGIADSLILGLLRDDGAVIYLNDEEIYRSNMPLGPVDFLTPAVNRVTDSLEGNYEIITLSRKLLKPGINYLAVEVHLAGPSSEDLSFDLFLDEKPLPRTEASGCTEGHENHIACFTSILPQDQGPGIVLPSSHTFQVLFQAGEMYQNVATYAPGNNDLAAYVPNTGSSTNGFLNVNHETNPGGVSILDIHYDSVFQVWVRDSLNKLDVFNSDIAFTSFNCSGAVTPWGTSISSEETYSVGDINGDGYEDVGWNFEIDPATRSIRAYGNGYPEKLWAMGRMKHENVAIASDSITVYQGEDGGSSAIFKFVADSSGDLSSGTLFVLRLEKDLLNGEVVSPSGKWIRINNTTKDQRNRTSELAIAAGGTNFNTVEEVEINPSTGEVYFASEGNNRIYRFKDLGRSVSNFETFVGEEDYSFIINGNMESESWGRNNDNLQFDDLGNLWVTQDADRKYIWMVRADHKNYDPRVELFGSFPQGSEPTGMSFTPDHKFMFLSIQHPSDANSTITDATGQSYDMTLSTTIVISRSEFLGPSTQATALIGRNPETCDQLELSWIKGTGDASLVVARTDTADNAFPVNTVVYSAPSLDVGLGDEIGSGNYVLFDGMADSVVISSLMKGQEYLFTVYNYVLENGQPFYNISNPAQLSFSFDSVNTREISGNTRQNQDDVSDYKVTPQTGYSYLWSVVGGSIQSGQMTEQVSIKWEVPGEGKVQVIATSDQGCEGEPNDFPVLVNFRTGIEERLESFGLTIHPNPSQGLTHVSISKNYQNVSLSLYNTLGIKKEVKFNKQGSDYLFDAEMLERGYYFLEVLLDEQRVSFPILIR